ncbi:MAG TPA: hypothetical protein VI248_25895 [Kineosporiaceae bacterium]
MVNRDGPVFTNVPPDPEDPPRGSRLTVVRSRYAASRSLLEPLMIIVIGLALGLVDQSASEVSSALRVPALIAALVLVGQGLNLLEEVRGARQVEEVAHQHVAAGAADETAVLPPQPQQQIVVAGSEDDVAESRRAPARSYLVLALAIWLGVATLSFPTAPLSLILLSLLSAYLIFAKAWRTLQTTSE